MSPGTIYWANLESGRRPAIVASREELNRGKYVNVIFCTTAHLDRRQHLPNCVNFAAGECGMTSACVAPCESLSMIEVGLLDFEFGPIGVLDDQKQRELVRAIGYVMRADCEPLEK